MFTLFLILMIILLWKLIGLAIKASWSLLKIFVRIFLFPLALLGMFIYGLTYLSIILVLIGFIGSFILD